MQTEKYALETQLEELKSQAQMIIEESKKRVDQLSQTLQEKLAETQEQLNQLTKDRDEAISTGREVNEN